jgi:hypothetical protein
MRMAVLGPGLRVLAGDTGSRLQRVGHCQLGKDARGRVSKRTWTRQQGNTDASQAGAASMNSHRGA